MLLIAIVVLMIATQTVQLRRTMVSYAAEITAPGLTHRVEILRDQNNIPHIFSEDEYAVYFALGRAHATDRPWQMEMSRRIVQGRMAEILGKPGLQVDRFLRTLGLYRATESSHAILSAHAQNTLEAYSKGVNSVFATKGRELSPEFILLGHTPEPWTSIDSLAALRLMSIGLSTNMQSELRRIALLTKLSPQQLAELMPPYPGDQSVELPNLTELYPNMADIETLASLTLPDFGSIEASNNWVVDGNHTKTGKPLLANDPHLGFSAPSIWYLAHLALPQGNIVGATLPGFPTVVIGRTDRTAWGFTNTGPDVQDLYLEKINPDNPLEYLTPEGWQSFDTRTETIKVRLGRDVELTVRQTRHGPVLPSDPDDELPFPPQGHVLALAWTGLSTTDRGLDAFLAAGAAKSWGDFVRALEPIDAPMQNVVYADMSGTIGYLAPGKVPIRAPDHQTLGLMPAPGWTSRNDWQGMIPYDQLPRLANPDSGIIATANHKITPPGYPYHLTVEWGVPYRANRIYQQLESRDDHDAESFAAIQTDNTSGFAHEILPLLLSTTPNDGASTKALTLLHDWDGHLRADRSEGLIFSAWVLELTREIVADDLGDMADRVHRANPYFLLNVLKDEAGQSRWCNDIESEEEVETCAEVLSDSLSTAMAHLTKTYGSDMSTWRWGLAHKAVHTHRPFGTMPILNRFFNIVTETGGGPFSPNQGSYYGSGENPFTNRHGAGYRAIYDFDNLEKSLFIQTTGQSGNILSPHYDDFATLWRDGKMIEIPTNHSEIERTLPTRTQLMPE